MEELGAGTGIDETQSSSFQPYMVPVRQKPPYRAIFDQILSKMTMFPGELFKNIKFWAQTL